MKKHHDIIVQDAVEGRRLSGLSGAVVYLMTRDSRHWFVRKAAQTPANNARLRCQAAKQRAFAVEAEGVISTPNILDEGEVDGRYYFDMEFVQGPDGASYLLRANYEEVTQFAERLCEYLRLAAQKPALGPVTHHTLFDALYSKICEVQASTGRISGENLSRLFLALNSVRQLGTLAPTLCHGDLTLQNMVVGPGGAICVVDLLDSPFEHYWQDVAKLHQDLSGGWYLLEQPRVAQCVLDFVSQRLMQAATRLYVGYPQMHALLLACTFIRILPYARTPEETQFITERIHYFAERAGGLNR